VTDPIPHWPGRLVSLRDGTRVWLAGTPAPGTQDENGGRETVLCLHGMTGDATNWTDFMARLLPDFDGKAVDLPGSGFSPPPGTPRGYSITALAGTVINLIETLQREAGHPAPLHLVGNSMGGDVALRVAARRPDLVKSLTLISAALPDRRPHHNTAHFPLLALPVLGHSILRQYGRFPAEQRIAGVLQTCYYDPASVHPVRLALAVEELRRRDGLDHGITSMARAARTLVAETFRPHRFSLWRDAERVRMPALVLFGTHDRLVSPALAARAARTFPGARVVVLPNTGHLGQMEHPDTVASLFREMVARARGAAGPQGAAGQEGAASAAGDGRTLAGEQGMPAAAP
jgi:pimeloyl-ACP methyl ester carboxylesterase